MSWASWTLATTMLLSGLAGCVKPYDEPVETPPIACDVCACGACGCGDCGCEGDCDCFGCRSPPPVGVCPELSLDDRATFTSWACPAPPVPTPAIGEFLALPVAPCEDACGRVPFAVGGDRMVFVVAAHRLYRSTHGMPFEELALPAPPFAVPVRTSLESVDVVEDRLLVWSALAHDATLGLDAGVLVAVSDDWGATWKNIRVLGPHPGARALELAGGGGALFVAVVDHAGMWARWLYDDGATIGLPELVRAAPEGGIEIGEPLLLAEGGAIVPMLERDLAGQGGARLAVNALGEWRIDEMPPGAAAPPDITEPLPGALAAAWLDAGGGVRVARYEDEAWSEPEHWGDAIGAPALATNARGGLEVAWVRGSEPTELILRRVVPGAGIDAEAIVSVWDAHPDMIAAPPLVELGGQAALGWIGLEGEEAMVMAAVEHHARPRQMYAA